MKVVIIFRDKKNDDFFTDDATDAYFMSGVFCVIKPTEQHIFPAEVVLQMMIGKGEE